MRFLFLLTVLGVAATAVAEQPADIVASVNGLVCDFCAQAIEKAIGLDERIAEVDVNLDQATVNFWLQKGGLYPDEEVAQIIAEAGYSLVEIQRSKLPAQGVE